MINIQAIALKLLLSCEDKAVALDTYEASSVEFFTGMYRDVFSAMTKFYNEQGEVATLSTLAVKFSRNQQIQVAVDALAQVDAEGIDLDLAVEALKDEYAQQETLKLIQSNVLANISMLSSSDIVDAVSSIPLAIETKLQSRGSLLTQADIHVFQKKEDMDLHYMNTGISNKWDSEFRGIAREEVVLFGGRRGSGKSVVCANLVANQWREGKIAPYYTIEMTGRETLLRILAILANVSALDIKTGTLKGEELLRLAKTRAEMFKEGSQAYERFIEGKNTDEMQFEDFWELDKALCRDFEIGHPLIIIDDSELKLSTIDVSLSKLKSRYGDLLTLAVVDYLNEVKMDGKSDPYDWVYQKEVATGFKTLARKHGIGIASPYQVSDTGEARFSKAILDPVDMAFVLKACKKNNHITFASTKLRSLPDSVFRIPIDWKTLAISPADIPMDIEDEEHEDEEEQRPKRSRSKAKKTDPNPQHDDLGSSSFELN